MTIPRMAELLVQSLQAERNGALKHAVELCRQALAETGSESALDVRLRLGKLLLSLGGTHISEAQEVLETARELANSDGSIRHESTAEHLLALVARRQGNLSRAVALLEDSPVLRDPSAPGQQMGQLFHYRGLLAGDSGDLVNSERLLLRAWGFYREAGYEPGEAEVLDSLANNLLRRGNTSSARKFCQIALDLKRKSHDRYGEAITLGTIGRIELLANEPVAAKQAFSEDLEIAREIGDQQGIAIMLNSLADVAMLERQFVEAESLYRDSRTQIPEETNCYFATVGMVRALLAQGRHEDAAAEHSQLSRWQPYDRPDLDAVTRGWGAAIIARQGDAEIAEGELSQTVQVLKDRNQLLDAIPFLFELRDLYQSRGDLAKAASRMGEVLDLWSECGAARGVAEIEAWLRQVEHPDLMRLVLERHFPDFVVSEVLAGLKLPEPKLSRVTILFCDIRGYTSMSEGLRPTEIVEVLNEWFSEASVAIRRHGGVIDKFIGDAVLALFGVPEPSERDASAAVGAAIDMRDALRSFNLRRQALGGAPLRIGIGIDQGEVVVGFIGSHLRQSYTAIGDAVNTASRLEGTTKDYPGCEILISERVEREQVAQGTAETEFKGLAELKGKAQPLAVYQVHGYRRKH
jgi:class 3 adenylate cyclase/tetratricopeptide (TPR) repeat protein